MPYQAILFDMDGVIIDSEPLYLNHMRKRLQTIGKDMSRDLFIKQVGMSTQTSAPMITQELKINMSPEEYSNFLQHQDMFDAVINGTQSLNLMPHIKEILETFKGRLKYSVGTGSPIPFVNAVRKKFNLDSHFSAYVSAEEVAKGKPSPDIFLEAAKRLDVPIQNCIVIDDAPAGMMAGKSAGAYVISVFNEWTSHFSFDQADYICASLAEAQNHIEELIK